MNRVVFSMFLRSTERFGGLLCCRLSTSKFLNSTSAGASMPSPDEYSEKVQRIATQITQMTVVEVSELNQLLKKMLKLPDTPMMAAMAPMAAAPGGAAAAAEDISEPASAKTSFTVKITGFDDKKKVALIKEIKSLIEGMNLVQSKKFVESLPQVVKADIGKDDADALKAKLEASGATVVIE